MTEAFFADVPFLRGKYHKVDEPFDSFDRFAYHGWEGAAGTGISDEEMIEAVKDIMKKNVDRPRVYQKALCEKYILEHSPIDINEHDKFPLFYSWGRLLRPLMWVTWARENEANKLSEFYRDYRHSMAKKGAIAMWGDYDHSIPDWRLLYKVGFPGILENVQIAHRKATDLTEKQEAFFTSMEMVWKSLIDLCLRFAGLAKTKGTARAEREAESLYRLAAGAPKTAYDVLMLIYLFFMIGESVDLTQVRSLGSGLDHDLAPYYEADLAAGRTTEEEFREDLSYFLMQWTGIGNYWGQPLYLGGTNPDGTTKFNAVSHIILDTYRKIGIYNPKIQIKVGKSTPDSVLTEVLDAIRHNTSIVLICEDNVRRNMEKVYGITPEEACDFDVKGCYEYAVRAKETSTAPLYINMPYGVLAVFEDEAEPATYEEFEKAYFEKMGKVYSDGIKAVAELETNMDEVNPTLFYSATISASLEKKADAYQNGTTYNNTAFVNSGIGSAVDCLCAVKILIYDKKICTYAEMKDALKKNFEGYESLRRAALLLPEKFGNGNPLADEITERVADFAASFQGTPNVRGGFWKMTVHSARHFIIFGSRMGATPDGRLAGEETSKNSSPVIGMDRNGCTALMRSVLRTKPYRFTEGHCLDCMLHPTSVEGEEGMIAMKAMLKVYMEGGGSAVQFNVLSADTLKQAQKEPERFSNLQIRVCGWNVLFNDMCKEEQDTYILRAENIAE